MVSNEEIQAMAKALGYKDDFDEKSEIDSILRDAEIVARKTTYKWVV